VYKIKVRKKFTSFYFESYTLVFLCENYSYYRETCKHRICTLNYALVRYKSWHFRKYFISFLCLYFGLGVHELVGLQPGAVVHTCNPGYLGDWDQENCCSRPAQSKRSRDPHLSGKKLSIVVHICHSYSGKLKQGIIWSRAAWAKSKTLSPK
jgi:hypothetical protein